MAKINVLDSSIYNKISAGEVVERPASVIKELTENCIDAGAKNIVIDIRNGGIENMTVTDDGCGIEYDSVKNAFLPHATSKINTADDLNSILTLGFRGEALASIASVSEVEMITKTSEDDLATFISLNAGNVLSLERRSAPNGTKISINNLFFNVPARKKFLKKPKQEEHEITTIVQRLILSNPNVSIRYFADGKQIYYSTGKNLEDAIFAIYGISTLQNLLKFDEKRNDMHLYGYIGKPSFTKANRTYQTLVVNNRFVQNSNISVAVNKGFETHLMKGQFPFFIMFLDINPERIDVNVHPTKMEIRFEDNGEIFSFVYRTVSNTILSNQDLFSVDMIDKPISSLKKLEKTFEEEKVEQQDAFKTFDNIFTPSAEPKTTGNGYSNSNNFGILSSRQVDAQNATAEGEEKHTKWGSEFDDFPMETSILPPSGGIPSAEDLPVKKTITSQMLSEMVSPSASNSFFNGDINIRMEVCETEEEARKSEIYYEASPPKPKKQPPKTEQKTSDGKFFYDDNGKYFIDKIDIYDKNDKLVTTKEIKIYEDFDIEEMIHTMDSMDLTGSTGQDSVMFGKTDGTRNVVDLLAERDKKKEQNTTALLQNGYKVVGKLFNTFLFVEHKDIAILIDQHAAHERIIYDRLTKYYNKRNTAVQTLLVPYILEVNYQEKSFIQENLEQFCNLGFQIEEFGDKAFKVATVPLLLGGNFDCKTYFNDILKQYGKEVKVKDSLKINEYLMQRACKAAIKAGNDMSESEICYLVDAVVENKTELFCPHGRPIAIKIERKDVEKWFKRVL